MIAYDPVTLIKALSIMIKQYHYLWLSTWKHDGMNACKYEQIAAHKFENGKVDRLKKFQQIILVRFHEFRGWFR